VLTQAQRLAVVKEIWALNAQVPGGMGCGYRALDAYERAVKEQA
jgi:hypothetical protein